VTPIIASLLGPPGAVALAAGRQQWPGRAKNAAVVGSALDVPLATPRVLGGVSRATTMPVVKNAKHGRQLFELF
jgi:hypothetical protein